MRKVISPSGHYQLAITSNRDPATYGSRGVVTRISDNKEIADISRNYINFDYSFFTKDGREWLLTGRTYLSQLYIDLDNEKMFDFPSGDNFSFCPESVLASPSGKTLAIGGSIFACSAALILFHDWSDTTKAPIELKIQKDFYVDLTIVSNCKWTSEDTFEFDQPETNDEDSPTKHYILRREGDLLIPL